MRDNNQQTVVYHRLRGNEMNKIRRVPARTQIIGYLIFKYQDIRSLNGSVQFFFQRNKILTFKDHQKSLRQMLYYSLIFSSPLWGTWKDDNSCLLEIRHDNVTCFGQWHVRGGEECNFSVEVFNCQSWKFLALLWQSLKDILMEGRIQSYHLKITSGESFRAAKRTLHGAKLNLV